MPQEHSSRREVINAIRGIDSIADLLASHEGHFDYELDLEVNVYGRNYNGKKVGPYLRLLTYEPGEAVITQGDWGGNTFFILVDGNLEVFVKSSGQADKKVAELNPGTQFGEMSVLAGVPRNATVRAASSAPAKVLEVQRPALRLLRKLPRFAKNLDETYRSHGRNATIEELKRIVSLAPEQATELRGMSLFKVFSKNHILFREKAPIDRIYIVKEGWLRRTQTTPHGEEEDFLGRGYCFGLEGGTKNSEWPYTVTLMGRTEVLEISIGKLRQNAALRDAVLSQLAQYAPPAFKERLPSQPDAQQKTLAAQESLIDMGLVDGNNLLVMDMELCVRCGNCSLACHHMHGQSRLLRRGVHITRLEKIKSVNIQSALSPSVCMHCQDPECLTGCPTGAIGRFGRGEVDINPKTCIGCGDCASQCPYNAITLIPRKAKEAQAVGGFGAKLRDLLRLTPDPIPPAVDTTEDLVAIKCNLCNHTPLNPLDANEKPIYKRPAYSCEENCPTGALARVRPREYFEEVGAIQGLMLVDRTHAVGRNIHRKDPPRRLSHLLGIALTVVLTAVMLIGLDRYGLGERLLGFLNLRWITGLVGLLGIGVVMAYPFRRQIYRRRAGALRVWLLTHLYAGVTGGIMIFLHGGTDTGGMLTTALMISWDLVIATGLFGLLCYQAAPRLLTRIEGSPLLIDDLKMRREELRKEIAEAGSSPSEPLRSVVREKVIPRFLSLGYLIRQYTGREPVDRLIEEAKAMFSSEEARLEDERDRRRLRKAVEHAVALRRVDALIYLHRLLKVWLPPHVITTSLMLALMIVHIIQVIYYAAR
jgi:Fe-S-cluster-containing dehydrogenase component/CRP-like cAMP-binding protein